MKKKKLLLIIGGVVVVGGLVAMNMMMNTTNAIDVQTAEARTRDLIEIVSASGRIQPQTKVDITSEINGEIINLYVDEGAYVEVGQLLVVLDTVQLRSDVDQAHYAVIEVNARLTGAKATREQRAEEYERQKKLFTNKLTSETSLSNAKYADLNSRASYDATMAQSRQLQARYEKQLDFLSKAKIVAPMSGIITLLDCEVGEIAAAQTAFTQGKTLMTIADLSLFEVEVEVDETEINKIDLNQLAEIEVDAFPDTTFSGQVIEIGNTALLSGQGSQDQSTNFKVKVVFNDPNVRIRPGMSATVDITTNISKDATSIPYAAVVMRSYDIDSLENARLEQAEAGTTGVSEVQAAEVDDDSDENKDDDEDVEREELKGVFVIRDGKARFVEIETGIADRKNMEVTEGLIQGDTIISGPYRVLRTIKDGDDVKSTNKKDTEKNKS